MTDIGGDISRLLEQARGSTKRLIIQPKGVQTTDLRGRVRVRTAEAVNPTDQVARDEQGQGEAGELELHQITRKSGEIDGERTTRTLLRLVE